jgi:hypothetical protein
MFHTTHFNTSLQMEPAVEVWIELCFDTEAIQQHNRFVRDRTTNEIYTHYCPNFPQRRARIVVENPHAVPPETDGISRRLNQKAPAKVNMAAHAMLKL